MMLRSLFPRRRASNASVLYYKAAAPTKPVGICNLYCGGEYYSPAIPVCNPPHCHGALNAGFYVIC